MERDSHFVRVIPAVAAPHREGLDLELEIVPTGDGDCLILRAGGGEAILHLKARKGEFMFPYGDAALRRSRSRRGGLFVDAVASWLGLVLVSAPGKPERRLRGDISWVGIGHGADPYGVRWDTYKLFLRPLVEILEDAGIHWRMTDSEDEMVIEVSCLSLPVLSVAARLESRGAAGAGEARADHCIE